jgi:hypothetical protein
LRRSRIKHLCTLKKNNCFLFVEIADFSALEALPSGAAASSPPPPTRLPATPLFRRAGNEFLNIMYVNFTLQSAFGPKTDVCGDKTGSIVGDCLTG